MFLNLNIKRAFFTKTFLYFSIVPNQIKKLFIAATKSITTALSVPICHAAFGASYQMPPDSTVHCLGVIIRI